MGLSDNSIPDEKLPQCWSDDIRMNALFAPFRLKTANPESWDMKMKFWSDMLRLWCRCKKDPIVSASDAKYTFQRKGRTPACLEIVVEELYRNGEMSPISKYQHIFHNGPEGWMRWGARLAFKPAAFALTAVTSLLPARQALDSDGLPKASIDTTQRFVVESAVQDQATELLQKYPPGVERIGTVEDLMRHSNWEGSRETFEVLLGYLVAQGTAIKKEDVVKLAEPNKRVCPVSESEAALVRLLAAEARLEGDAMRLARDVTDVEGEARAALKLGNKIAAKNHLRRKHRLQQRAERCDTALDNVRQLANQLRQSQVNVAIVDTYKISTNAMKQDIKDNGLEDDGIHDIMDEIKEVMENYSDIEKALGSNVNNEEFDAVELEAELNELLSGPGGHSGGTPLKKETEDHGVKLPSPPAPRPSARRTLEPDFVFDGEERMIAELNELSIEEPSPDGKRAPVEKKAIAVADTWRKTEEPIVERPKPSKSWAPEEAAGKERGASASWSNNNMDASLRRLSESYAELQLDQRIHPGQKLNIDFNKSPRLYNADFQVRDHKMEEGVWIYNKDDNSNIDSSLAASTDYFSSESPGKSGGSFQMAPGGERKKSHTQAWATEHCPTVDELERRLKDLRGFNS